MPDDLLRLLVGPEPAPWWWAWTAGLLVAVLVAWYAGVLWFTRPDAHQPKLVGQLRDAWLRRRFAGAVRRIAQRHAAGESTDAQTGAELSRTLRDFLHAATGVRAQYLQVGEFGAEFGSAAALLARINDVRFNERPTEPVTDLTGATEELILTWS